MPLINFQACFALPVLAGVENYLRRHYQGRYHPRDRRETWQVEWRDTAEHVASTFVLPKRQTIRAMRKRGNPKSGDLLYLYTGARTKACRKLGVVRCGAVTGITITADGVYLEAFGGGGRLPFAAGWLHDEGLAEFAQADGFSSWEQMRDWFAAAHGLPFTGQLIKW